MFLRRIVTLIVFASVILWLQGCATEQSGSLGGDSQGVAAAQEETPPTGTVTPAPPSETPTVTPSPTDDSTPTPGPSSTPTETPTPSRTPTNTPVPTETPTPEPQTNPFLVQYGTPEKYLTATPPTPIPTPMQQFDVPPGVTNILLLGSDDPLSRGVGNTDTIIIASVNRDTKTASMVSLPRDLWVYIPGRTLGRINTAMPLGGVQLLKDTILYNFGVPIHYYARIDFEGFETVVDAIGGVDVPISCEFEDFRLISDDLDPQVEENWELFNVQPGVQHMDGSMALWYVRSRERVEADWGRSKRQQQVLRAILHHGLDLNLVPQIPELYSTYRDMVETDMDIGRILQLASIAPAVRDNDIQQLYIVGSQLQPWAVPDANPPMNVQLPRWENMRFTFYRLFNPPALNSGARAPIFVEIVNHTGNPDMAVLAADNLAWYGFAPVIAETQDNEEVESTSISYYGDNFKGSFDVLLSWIFSQRSQDIELVEDTPYDYEYRVVLGADYDPCINHLFAPYQE